MSCRRSQIVHFLRNIKVSGAKAVVETPRPSSMSFSNSVRRSQIVDFPEECQGFRDIVVSGDAAVFIYVVVRPCFSLCRSQNVDFPKEYQGFRGIGFRGG